MRLREIRSFSFIFMSKKVKYMRIMVIRGKVVVKVEITEKNFVEQMKKKNEKALVYMVEQYGWVLKTVVKRQMGTLPHLWDDCMNDTLLAVWENISSYDPERTEFQNWLAGVCRFKALTYVRKYIEASREDLVEQMPEWEDENAGYDFLKQEFKEEVDTILSYLKEDDARIFRLIYLEGLSMDEVAEKMKMSKTAIYGRISRGRKQMRKIVRESGV